jgi:signal transduction histidine kinase
MTRLIDPLFLDQSLRGYGLAATLALGGIGLALVLTFGLAAQLRREAAERDRLQAELRRSERLAAMGKLLAGVAHEVRNPLAGIRAIAQLWRRGLGFHEEGFERLIEEVDRLEGIVSRLLHFGRADLQEHTPENLNDVVAESAQLAADQAKESGVEVVLELAEDLPPVPMAASAILQIFRNLTSNAIQMMPDGGRLTLSTRFNRSHRAVEVRVTDTGPGLAPEVRSHLFEPFFTTKPEGTGLGLAIAREIALAHRGDLLAETPRKGPGAVFLLTLPVEDPNR